jgi:hypothetical protein
MVARTGNFPNRRKGAATRRFGAVRAAFGLLLALPWGIAVADSPQGSTDRASTRADAAPPPDSRDEASGESTRPVFESGAAALDALDAWYLVACDPTTGAAVVRRAGGGLRVVRRGERLESLEVAELRPDRLQLRPVPGSAGLEDVREVWLSRTRESDAPRIRIIRNRDEGDPHRRVVPPLSSEAPVPESARVVRAESVERDPR